MTAEKTVKAFGWRGYGLGVMALGMTCLGAICARGFPGPHRFGLCRRRLHAGRGRGCP